MRRNRRDDLPAVAIPASYCGLVETSHRHEFASRHVPRTEQQLSFLSEVREDFANTLADSSHGDGRIRIESPSLLPIRASSLRKDEDPKSRPSPNLS